MQSSLKVLFRFDAAPLLARRLKTLSGGGLEVELCSETDDEAYRRLLTQADVLWHVLRPVTAGDIGGAPRLKLIQKIGVGVNTIDLAAAKGRGIRVANMPGTNSHAVAEMTLLLMLAALRRLPAFDRWTRSGQGWSWPPALQDDLGELGGRTVGLVGYGAIPRSLTPALQALGARVLYSARAEKPDAAAKFCTLDQIIAEADIISLHVPLTPATERLFDKERIFAMKPGAILVNTARGALVDEEALVEALTSGHLRAAGLDVFAAEPLDPGSPLLALDNVVLAPHVAWLTPETLDRSLAVAIENCRRLTNSEPLLNEVPLP